MLGAGCSTAALTACGSLMTPCRSLDGWRAVSWTLCWQLWMEPLVRMACMHHLSLSPINLETGSHSQRHPASKLPEGKVGAALSTQTPLHGLMFIADAAKPQHALMIR